MSKRRSVNQVLELKKAKYAINDQASCPEYLKEYECICSLNIGKGLKATKMFQEGEFVTYFSKSPDESSEATPAPFHTTNHRASNLVIRYVRVKELMYPAFFASRDIRAGDRLECFENWTGDDSWLKTTDNENCLCHLFDAKDIEEAFESVLENTSTSFPSHNSSENLDAINELQCSPGFGSLVSEQSSSRVSPNILEGPVETTPLSIPPKSSNRINSGSNMSEICELKEPISDRFESSNYELRSNCLMSQNKPCENNISELNEYEGSNINAYFTDSYPSENDAGNSNYMNLENCSEMKAFSPPNEQEVDTSLELAEVPNTKIEYSKRKFAESVTSENSIKKSKIVDKPKESCQLRNLMAENMDVSIINEKKRPCCFCGTLQADISKHLLRAHKQENQVKLILQSKDPKERNSLLRALPLNEISKEKELQYREESEILPFHPSLVSETAVESTSREKLISVVEGLVNSRYNSEKRCTGSGFIHSENFSREFISLILHKMRSDKIGNLINSEKLLKVIANDEYLLMNKNLPNRIVRKRVSGYVRKIASIYLKLNVYLESLGKQKIEFIDMFRIEHCDALRYTIVECILRRDKGNFDNLQWYDITIKRSSVALISYFHHKGQQEERFNVLEFLCQYVKTAADADKKWDFGNKPTPTLKPKILRPSEEDIIGLHKFVSDELGKLLSGYYEFNRDFFVRLRRVTLARIIFFNCLRPIEITEFTIHDWVNAKADGVFSKEHSQILHEDDRNLVERFLIIRKFNKAFRRETKVLVPYPCYEALEVLSDMTTRNDSLISPSNEYLFPSAKMSPDPASGYHELRSICQVANLPQSICNDQVRCVIASQYISLENDRPDVQSLYKHLDEIKNMDEVFLQSRAFQRLQEIAQLLHDIDRKTWEGIQALPAHMRPEETNETKTIANSVTRKQDDFCKHLRSSCQHPSSSSDKVTKDIVVPRQNDATNDACRREEEKDGVSWSLMDKIYFRKFFCKVIKGAIKDYPKTSEIDKFLSSNPDFMNTISQKKLKKRFVRQKLDKLFEQFAEN